MWQFLKERSWVPDASSRKGHLSLVPSDTPPPFAAHTWEQLPVSYGLGRRTILKIDIEGAECAVLEAMLAQPRDIAARFCRVPSLACFGRS